LQILTEKDIQGFGRVRLVFKGTNQIMHITEAYKQAEDLGLDLVIISHTTTPPVVKIEDFKKIQYEKKKARTKSKQVSSSLKEIQFKVNISSHDLGTKISSISRFLKRGDKVKITVCLKGREKESPEKAKELIVRVTEQVSCKVNVMNSPVPTVILEPPTKKKTGK